MGQCRTLDADVSIGCYYGDHSSCDSLRRNKFFSLTLVCLLFELLKLQLVIV